MNEDVMYAIQMKSNGSWCGSLCPEGSLDDAMRRKEHFKSGYPQFDFRVVKITTVTEVMEEQE